MKRVLPFLLLGPLTGPLVAGFFFTVREQRFGMAAVYVLGALEVALGLPTIFAREVSFIAAHLH